MTAAVSFLGDASKAQQCIEAQKRFDRLQRCWRDGMPTSPDALLDELADLAIEAGRPFAPSPAMRALLRAAQKALEAAA